LERQLTSSTRKKSGTVLISFITKLAELVLSTSVLLPRQAQLISLRLFTFLVLTTLDTKRSQRMPSLSIRGTLVMREHIMLILSFLVLPILRSKVSMLTLMEDLSKLDQLSLLQASEERTG
jgi:hypothetical protein